MNSKETGVSGGRQWNYFGSILQYKKILVFLLFVFLPLNAQLVPLYWWVTLSLLSQTLCSRCFGTPVTFCQRQWLCNVFICMNCFSILLTNLITYVSIQDCFVSGHKCYFTADLLFYAPANMHQTKYLHRLKTLACGVVTQTNECYEERFPRIAVKSEDLVMGCISCVW